MRSEASARRAWALVGALLCLFAIHAWWVKHGGDFAVFHLAAGRAMRGDALYRLEEGMPFKYLPASSLILTPLALLPRRAAWLLWNGGSALALLALLRRSVGDHGARETLLRATLVLAVQMPFVLQLFALGQVDALLLALMLLSEGAATRRPVLSGLWWCAACLFKPPYLVFLLLALPLRQWKRLAALGGGLSAALLVPALRSGVSGAWTELVAWRHLLAVTTPPMLCANPENQSAFAIACTYLARDTSPFFLLGVAALSAAVVGAFALATWQAASRGSAERARQVAVASVFYLAAFLSPLGWQTNLLSTIPLLGLLVGVLRTSPSARVRGTLWWLLAAAVCVNLLCYDVLGRDAARAVLSYRHYGLATLALALSAAFAAARAPAREEDGPASSAPAAAGHSTEAARITSPT